jgi:hypothetical protein
VGYRDELEAANARADAAEQTVGELRRELAMRDFPEVEPLCPPPRFWMSRKWWFWAVLALGGAALAVIAFVK